MVSRIARTAPRSAALMTRQSLLRTQKVASKCVIGSKRSFSSPHLHYKPVITGNGSFSSPANKTFRVGAASASAIASVLVACKLVKGNDARSAVASMESSHDHGNDFTIMHEPGTIEEMQRVVAECFENNNCFGLSHERLFDMVQAAFTDAMKNYSNDKSSMDQVVEPNNAIRKANKQFPSLKLTLLNDNCPSFELNSTRPIPIENDLFVGNISIIIQPQSSCMNDSHFNDEYFSKRAKFEIQLQGRFKRKPNGTIYCGGELADENFRYSTFMRGLGNVLLKGLVKFIGPNIEYSFGGKDSTGRNELAHISFPLQTAMYDIVRTSPGETPPPMGQPFVEAEEARALRKASADTHDWSLEDTYSMSFSGSSLDLPTWSVLYPCEASLSWFWGNSPLRLVIYEKGEQQQQREEETIQASRNTNNYLFALQMEFLGLKQELDDMDTVAKNTARVQRSPVSAAALS